MGTQVHGPLLDYPVNPDPVREIVELHLLDPKAQLDADLLAPLRPYLVGPPLLPPEGGGLHHVTGLDKVVEVPQIIQALRKKLDGARLHVPPENLHGSTKGRGLFVHIEAT